MNTVRYATMLEIRKKTWARSQGGGVDEAEPSASTNPSVMFTGGESGGPGRHVNIPRDAEVGFTPSTDQTTVKGGYVQDIRARRKTRFEPGKAHFYGSEIELTVTLTSTWVPSRLVNTVGLNLPHYLASAAQNAGDQRAVDARTQVSLSERMIIPHGQLTGEILPPAPPGEVAAVEEVQAGIVPGRVLPITSRHIEDHEVLPLGWDHEKLRVFFDEALAKLAGNERPISGDRSFAVGRLVEHGTRSRDALYYILSYASFTGQLDRLLRDEGMTMPLLVREGGPLTDNYGRVTVKVAFTDPQMLGWFLGWVEAVNYDFDERQEYVSRTFGMALSVAGGGELNTGNLSETLSPVSPARRTVGGLADASVGRSDTKTTSATQQVMTRYDAINRAVPRLRVSADAIITIEAEAQNRRGGLIVPVPGLRGGRVTVAYRVRHAAELGLSPESAMEFGLHHPGGIPVSSGTYYPGPGDTGAEVREDRLRAAYLVPFLNRAFAVQIELSDGKFLIGRDRADAGQLAAHINRRLGQLGPPPSPDLSEEERPPPAPRRLESPFDPIILLAPGAGTIPPGALSPPAQELADALQRPVIAPDTPYVITRDGSVLAVDAIPGDAAFGQGWRRGRWVAFFPRRRPAAVREMARADLDAVTALDNDVFPDDPWFRPHYAGELAPVSRYYIVAEEAGRVIGHAGMFIDGTEAAVIMIAVAPASQGRGVGADLLQRLLAEATQRKATQMTVRLPESHQLTDYFTARGFVLSGYDRDWYGEGVHADVFRLDLSAAELPAAVPARPPYSLPYNLADAIAEASRDLGWAGVEVAANPGRPAHGSAAVPAPGDDVRVGARTFAEAMEDWRQGQAATHQLAVAARDLLSLLSHAKRDELAPELDAADRTVRAVPGPSASPPATALAQEAAWDDLARFRRAAAELGRAAASVFGAVLAIWQDKSRLDSERVQRLRAALPRRLAADLAGPFQALQHAELAISRAPQVVPASGLDMLAAMRPVLGGLDARPGITAFDRAEVELLNAALRGWSQRVTTANELADAAEHLIVHTGVDSAVHEGALRLARAGIPATAPGPVRSRAMDSAWIMDAMEALHSLSALEDATRAILRDASSLQGLQRHMAQWRERADTARGQLPLTGDRRGPLTEALDQAIRRLENARPDWWADDADDLDTAKAITEFGAGIEKVNLQDKPGLRNLRAAMYRSQRVLREIQSASERSAARAGDVSASIRTVLPYAGPRRYALERALNRAEVAVPPGASRQAVRRAIERADLWREVLSAVTAELKARAAAAVKLAEAMEDLLPGAGVGPGHDQMTIRFYLSLEAVSDLKLGTGPVDSAEQIERSARHLRAAAISVQLLESMNGSVVAAAITQPQGRLSDLIRRLAAEARRLLPYVAGVDPQLHDDLLALLRRADALPGFQPLQLVSAADVPSAESRLDDDQRLLRELTGAVRQALGGSWQARMLHARDLTGDLGTLIGASGQSQVLSPGFDRAARVLTAAPDTLPALAGVNPIADAEAVLRDSGHLAGFETAAELVLASTSSSAERHLPAILALGEAVQRLTSSASELNQADVSALEIQLRPLRAAAELPGQPRLTAEDVAAVRRRLADQAGLEEAASTLRDAAFAPLDNLRPRADLALRLAERMHPLLPSVLSAGGAGLSTGLDAAVRGLRAVRPDYWTKGLDTAAQVEAAGPALAAGTLDSVERAIEELERAVQAAAVAAAARLRTAAEEMIDAAGDLRRVMTDTGRPLVFVAPGLADALRAVAALAERDRLAAPAAPAVLTAGELGAIIADLASLADVGAAIWDGIGALGQAVWQEAADLRDLSRTVSELVRNVGSPDVSGKFSLPDAPDQSPSIKPRIDAMRKTAGDAADLRSELTEVTDQAIADLGSRAARTIRLGEAARELLENAAELVPGAQGLKDKLTDALARVGQDAPAMGAPLPELADRVLGASRVHASVIALAETTEHVLTIATTGLAERVEAVRGLESLLPSLLPFAGAELANLAPDLDAARGAVRDLPDLSDRRPRGPDAVDLAVDWVRRAGHGFAVMARLIAVARIVAAAAAGSLDELQADVAATLELARAARQFRLAGVPGGIDDAVRQLRAQQPPWWPATAASLTTAQEASVVIAAMAARDATRQALEDGIASVLSEALQIISQRAGAIVKRAIAGRGLVAVDDQQSLSDRFEEISRRAQDLERSEPRPGTLADAEATAADLERLSYLQAEVERVIAQATAGLAERLAAAGPLAGAAMALLPHVGAGQENLRQRVAAARDRLNDLPALPGSLSTKADLLAAAETLARLADLENAVGEVLTSATEPVDRQLQQVTQNRRLAHLVRSLAPANEPGPIDELIAASNAALAGTYELVPPWWQRLGAPVRGPGLLDDVRAVLDEGLLATVRRTARELRTTSQALHAGVLARWDDQRARADVLVAEIRADLPGTGARRNQLTGAVNRLEAAVDDLRPVPDFQRIVGFARADATARRPSGPVSPLADAVAGMAELTGAFTELDEASRRVPWVRARTLLGDDRAQFSSARVTAVLALADRLRLSAQAGSDAEHFTWLAEQVGLHHQDSRLRPAPALAPLRIFRLLDLAFEILDQSEASLDAVRDLRRLADLLPAPDGLAGGLTSQQITANLATSFADLLPAELTGPGVADVLQARALVELAGQAKDARQLNRGLMSRENLRRRIARDDLQGVRDSAGHVEEAERYLNGGPDLTAERVEQLAGQLLNGTHTDYALRSVLGLFRASGPAELTRLLKQPGCQR